MRLTFGSHALQAKKNQWGSRGPLLRKEGTWPRAGERVETHPLIGRKSSQPEQGHFSEQIPGGRERSLSWIGQPMEHYGDHSPGETRIVP